MAKLCLKPEMLLSCAMKAGLVVRPTKCILYFHYDVKSFDRLEQNGIDSLYYVLTDDFIERVPCFQKFPLLFSLPKHCPPTSQGPRKCTLTPVPQRRTLRLTSERLGAQTREIDRAHYPWAHLCLHLIRT